MNRREFRRRFRKVIKIMEDIADQYEQEEPNWVFLTAMELTKGALQSLRYYLEHPDESGITWAEPWVEAQYPVDWDWKDYHAVYNTFTAEDLEAAEVVARKIEETLAKHVDVYVFKELTHHMALHKRGDTFYYLLPKDLIPVIEKLPADEREKALDELYEPFMMFGAKSEDFIPVLDNLTEEAREKVIQDLGDENKERIAQTLFTGDVDAKTAAERADEAGTWPPELRFHGDVDGAEFEGFVFVQFHPLIIDEDEHRAYYPVQTGLFFTRGDPSTWGGEAAAEFWDEVFTGIDKGIAETAKALQEAAPGAPQTIELEGIPSEEALGTPAVELVPADVETRLIPSVPTVEEAAPRRTVGLAFGGTLASTRALSIVQSAHKVRLPRKWSTIPRWKELVRNEVQRIQEEEGDRAYEDRRAATGDPRERGKLLKKRYRAGGGEEVLLTEEAKRALMRRAGLGVGYIDVDQYGNEGLVRLYEVGPTGLLEIGLSWQGLAGPLVDEWRAEFRKRAEELQREVVQPLLFADLDEERRRVIDSMLDHIRLWEDGRRIMEVILGQVGKQSRNPVEIPAEAFRVLLWPEASRTQDWPQNWKQRVDGALSALHALTFRYRTYSTDEVVKGYGGFLGEWVYVGRGQGAHGDGVYVLDVQPGFLGCLRVFETGKTHLRSGKEAVVFEFGRKPTAEERKALGWGKNQKAEDTFTTFDAGRAFYTSAAGLTSTQENLLHWLERNLTLKEDTVRGGHKAAKVNQRAPDAKERRVYGPDFCPLLPPGRAYLGALGHFRRNPEIGFKLWGTESRLARHTAGLMVEMGYLLPPGAARAKRAAMVTEALQDLKAVVVDYLGGEVIGQDVSNWVPLEKFRDLDEKVLCHRLRIYCFVPKDYEAARRAQWEETTDRRATDSIQEAEWDAWDRTDAPVVDEPEDVDEALTAPLGRRVVSPDDGYRGLPLHTRLHMLMKERKLKAKDLAAIFGVDPALITKWLKGPTPDPDGKVRGRAVPEDLVPLVVRWIETGVEPMPEELAARPGRRPGVNPETRKPRRPGG